MADMMVSKWDSSIPLLMVRRTDDLSFLLLDSEWDIRKE